MYHEENMESGEGAFNNRSRIFQFASWLLFVVALFAVLARLTTRYAMTRKLMWDDWILLQAQAAALAQSIAVSTAASSGLGQAISSLTVDSVDSIMKAVYVSALFVILASALVKLSLLISIKHLTPNNRDQYINKGIGAVVVLWFVPAILVSVFQCALPTPWDFTAGRRCVDRGAFWSFVTVVNMATDFGIVALHAAIITQLHLLLSRKLTLLLVFSTRLLVIPATAIQLVTFRHQLSDPNITFGLWLPTLLNQLILCLSITTACMPYLKPFMASLDSGILRVEGESSQEHLSGEGSRENNSHVLITIGGSVCGSSGVGRS